MGEGETDLTAIYDLAKKYEPRIRQVVADFPAISSLAKKSEKTDKMLNSEKKLSRKAGPSEVVPAAGARKKADEEEEAAAASRSDDEVLARQAEHSDASETTCGLMVGSIVVTKSKQQKDLYNDQNGVVVQLLAKKAKVRLETGPRINEVRDFPYEMLLLHPNEKYREHNLGKRRKKHGDRASAKDGDKSDKAQDGDKDKASVKDGEKGAKDEKSKDAKKGKDKGEDTSAAIFGPEASLMAVV
jgi:hypothetical protein